ncbi:hypothetical protein AB7M16_004744 [Bradyrhizobium sp. USDA 372]
MCPTQCEYIAALIKLHDQHIEALRVSPAIEKEYAEMLLLRERIRTALDRKDHVLAPELIGSRNRPISRA